MKFEHYLNKLHESNEYKKFSRKYKKEYMCAGFFVLDYETGKHSHQIDYYLPNNKIATFILDEGVKMKLSEQTIKKSLPKLKEDIKIDLEALKGIVEDEMKNRTVTERIKKIIAILHVIDDKPVWNLQCILDGLTLLNVHVNDADQSILKFEKHSLMELIKPMAGMMQQQIQQQQEQEQPKASVISEKDLKELERQIKQAEKQEKSAKKKK